MSEQVIKIFLVDDAYVELEDAFVDKEKDLRSEVNKILKTIIKSAKMTKINKTMVVNIKKDDEETGERKMEQDTIKLKEVNLEKFVLESDPSWIPEKMDKDEVKIYSQKVGDATWKYLQYFSKIYGARLDKYNKSLNSDEDKQKAEFPKCFEQLIHEQLISGINTIITKHIEKEFDKEFKELEDAEDNKKPKAGSRDKKD